jgi:hypothetical protein
VAVTFRVPPEAGADSAAILGEFTEWAAVPMTPGGDGAHELTVELPAGSSYRFRYLLDGARWANDWAADDYVANTYGSDDSVVIVEPIDGDAPSPTETRPKASTKPAAKTASKSTGKTTSTSTSKSTSKSAAKTTTKNSKAKKAEGADPPAKRTAAKKAAGPGTPPPATRLR